MKVEYVNIVAPKVSLPGFNRAKKTAGLTREEAGTTRVITHDDFKINKNSRNWENSIVVVDEVHNFTKTKFDALKNSGATYFMLLSATTTPNVPSEIVNLVNILYPDSMSAERWDEHDWESTSTSEKHSFMMKKVSVYRVGTPGHMDMIGKGTVQAADGFPAYSVKTVTTHLSESQDTLHR
ncbi:unnamed protein product [Laminaria digitata]